MLPSLDDLRGRITEMRKQQDLTQADAAALIGRSQSFVAKLEAGSTSPSYNSVATLYNALEERRTAGDVIARELMTEDIVAVAPDDAVGDAKERMTQHGYSQLPVLSENQCVGTIRTAALLDVDPKDTIADHMAAPLPEVPPTTGRNAVTELLRSANAVIVRDTAPIGIITTADLL